MNMPAWRDWVFALKVLGAAILALFLALWIDLPRPYWAVSTVFITVRPLAGATRSKAIYRVCGTVLGAIVAVILVPSSSTRPSCSPSPSRSGSASVSTSRCSIGRPAVTC